MTSPDTVKELERLASNQQTLLEAMPEMVLLVNANKSIEYMNPSAVRFFGDLTKNNNELPPSSSDVVSQLLNLVKPLDRI